MVSIEAKKKISIIVSIVGAVLAFAGALLTIILSASKSYAEVNSVVKSAKKLNGLKGMSNISSLLSVKGVLKDATELVLNAFNWFRVSNFVWLAIVGIIMVAIPVAYMVKRMLKNNDIMTKKQIITMSATTIVATIALLVCVTMSAYSSALNKESKDMIRDGVETVVGAGIAGSMFK